MKPTLEALWLGDLCPGDEPPYNSDEIANARQSISESKEELVKTLEDKQKELLKELLLDLDFLSALETADAFEKGFSLATRLLTEALASNK